MRPGYLHNKVQADRAREALKVFQIATIDEIAKCLILSRHRVGMILNYHIPEINKMEIKSGERKPRFIFFLGGVENIESLINKKYKSILRKAG